MPKGAGEQMKPVRLASRAATPKSRPIKGQSLPTGAKLTAMSPGAPKIAADLKSVDTMKGGSIDPRQMRY
jgi:hypothetical protein